MDELVLAKDKQLHHDALQEVFFDCSNTSKLDLGDKFQIVNDIKMNINAFSKFAGRAGLFPRLLKESDLEAVYQEANLNSA